MGELPRLPRTLAHSPSLSTLDPGGPERGGGWGNALSRLLVDAYYNDLARLKQATGSVTEAVVSDAFKDLLKGWSRQKNLVFAPEYELISPQKTRIRPDGTILHALRVPLGHWEAKDEADNLDAEIDKKLRRGYPQDNILFEDSREAVLIQNRRRVMRCRMENGDELSRLLGLFFDYEPPTIGEFRKAVEQFKRDLPQVLEALRAMIDRAYAGNAAFGVAAAEFLAHARNTINPTLAEADVREMLIQHVLTEDIFSQVFDDPDFHRHNNIARELYKLETLFVGGPSKRELMAALRPYYSTIRASAAGIGSHKEKQKFLKVIYENFYKVYDQKKADRLGVVYTPSEIVKFMIESTDWLCRQHFGKALIDEGVEILDPATGTGTFICELLEHFRGQPDKLRRKYRDELHANEVAILPYYVANLNIEATYAEITGEYAEFQNLCFVDTLDNIAGLGIRRGHQHELFAGLADENLERVKRQNRRKISVVIGNPPYNANQQNESDNNKNREYPHVDRLIRNSYIEHSTAQKTKQYDMYKRFFRWASDRLGDEGIIAFVTNSAFIDARQDDGFRRVVAEEFSDIWIVDLKGNARTSGERRRREGGNVFDDQIRVGVAVTFLVKTRRKAGCTIRYEAVADFAKADDKRTFLSRASLEERSFQVVRPDKAHNWIGLAEQDWSELLPVASREAKAARPGARERAIFKLYSLGVVTNRDDWVYGHSSSDVLSKVRALTDGYETVRRGETPGPWSIKWTRLLKKLAASNVEIGLEEGRVIRAQFRPYFSRWLYYDGRLNEVRYQTPAMFGDLGSLPNRVICLGQSGAFRVLASAGLVDLHHTGDTQCLSRFRYTVSGKRVDNITTWAENKFRARYGKGVSKDDIFAYVYAVLNDPVYRETYAINLKREFPRIPLYPNFHKWRAWGQRLLDLHVGYDSVEPWPVSRQDGLDPRGRAAGLPPRAILRGSAGEGLIRIDSDTELRDVPPEAWSYRLGNRSAVEWVLDQYKEKTPRDPTIRERFNTYRFADHKEHVIDLIARVVRVSVETVGIVEEMRGGAR